MLGNVIHVQLKAQSVAISLEMERTAEPEHIIHKRLLLR